MRVASREGPGIAGANHMVAGAVFATACLKGPLRRPPAALDPRLLRQITHTNPRSPFFFGVITAWGPGGSVPFYRPAREYS